MNNIFLKSVFALCFLASLSTFAAQNCEDVSGSWRCLVASETDPVNPEAVIITAKQSETELNATMVKETTKETETPTKLQTLYLDGKERDSVIATPNGDLVSKEKTVCVKNKIVNTNTASVKEEGVEGKEITIIIVTTTLVKKAVTDLDIESMVRVFEKDSAKEVIKCKKI